MTLLKETKKIGYYISIDTVGATLLNDVAISDHKIIHKVSAKNIVKYVDKIGIPIDGSSNEIFNYFRPSKCNLLSQQLSICKELHKYNANICINTVVHKLNFDDATNLANLINKLDYINEWQLFQYAPIGKYGKLNKNLFKISNKKFLEFKSTIVENFKCPEKLKFKPYNSRNNMYILIDNSGNAWVQKFNDLKNEDRDIIGNICNKSDWGKICSYLNR